MATDQDQLLAKKARFLSLVIAGTMVLWIVAQWAGGQFGITARFRILFDLIAIAAFVWALVGIYQIWRARQGN